MVCRSVLQVKRSLFSRLVLSGLIISVTDSSRENVELSSKKRRRRHGQQIDGHAKTHRKQSLQLRANCIAQCELFAVDRELLGYITE